MEEIPLQRYISESGYCSRRKADEMLCKNSPSSSYVILVNGKLAEPGMKVGSKDEVTVNGKRIEPLESIYIKLNKPKGLVCTTASLKGERNVFDVLKKSEKGKKLLSFYRLFIAGRLDKDSRGMVLLMNDGLLANKLMHPRYGCEKEYLVKVKEGGFDPLQIRKLFLKGVKIKGSDRKTKAKEVEYLSGKQFRILLSEGKKRQIRRMFESTGLTVEELFREAIGGVSIGELNEEEWAHLTEKEIETLRENSKE